MGLLPKKGDIDTEGLDIDPDVMEALLAVDPAQWQAEMEAVGEYLRSFGERTPERLLAEHGAVMEKLAKAS